MYFINVSVCALQMLVLYKCLSILKSLVYLYFIHACLCLKLYSNVYGCLDAYIILYQLLCVCLVCRAWLYFRASAFPTLYFPVLVLLRRIKNTKPGRCVVYFLARSANIDKWFVHTKRVQLQNRRRRLRYHNGSMRSLFFKYPPSALTTSACSDVTWSGHVVWDNRSNTTRL